MRGRKVVRTVSDRFIFSPIWMATFVLKNTRGKLETPTDVALLITILGTTNEYFYRAVSYPAILDQWVDAEDEDYRLKVPISKYDLMRHLRVRQMRHVMSAYERVQSHDLGIQGNDAIADLSDYDDGNLVFWMVGPYLRRSAYGAYWCTDEDEPEPRIDPRVIADMKCRFSPPVYLRCRAWVDTRVRDGLHGCDMLPTHHGAGRRVRIPMCKLPDVLGAPDLAKKSNGDVMRILRAIERDFQSTELSIAFRPVTSRIARGRIDAVVMDVGRLEALPPMETGAPYRDLLDDVPTLMVGGVESP
jgi:hypothetical protein